MKFYNWSPSESEIWELISDIKYTLTHTLIIIESPLY